MIFVPEMSPFEAMRVFNGKQTATRIRNKVHIPKASFGSLDGSEAGMYNVCESQTQSSPMSEALIVLFLVFEPIGNPFNDPGHIRFHIFRGFALQFNNDLLCVRGPGFIENDLHDLCFIVFLDFFERIAAK
jgi:hypothetical protein